MVASASDHVPSPIIPVVQRDDGWWQVGIGDDAPGPFPTYACAVAHTTSKEMRKGRAASVRPP
jgi:hypothetical protein